MRSARAQAPLHGDCGARPRWLSKSICRGASQRSLCPCRLELPITHGEAAPDGGPAVAPLRIPLQWRRLRVCVR